MGREILSLQQSQNPVFRDRRPKYTCRADRSRAGQISVVRPDEASLRPYSAHTAFRESVPIPYRRGKFPTRVCRFRLFCRVRLRDPSASSPAFGQMLLGWPKFVKLHGALLFPSVPPGAERSTPLAMLGQGACAWLRAASGGGLRPALTIAARGALMNSGRDEETAAFGRTKKLSGRSALFGRSPRTENEPEL